MNEAKMRRCLGRCGEMRMSEGYGDRMCDKCKKANGEIARHGKRATQDTVSPHYRREIQDI